MIEIVIKECSLNYLLDYFEFGLEIERGVFNEYCY